MELAQAVPLRLSKYLKFANYKPFLQDRNFRYFDNRGVSLVPIPWNNIFKIFLWIKHVFLLQNFTTNHRFLSVRKFEENNRNPEIEGSRCPKLAPHGRVVVGVTPDTFRGHRGNVWGLWSGMESHYLWFLKNDYFLKKCHFFFLYGSLFRFCLTYPSASTPLVVKSV